MVRKIDLRNSVGFGWERMSPYSIPIIVISVLPLTAQHATLWRRPSSHKTSIGRASHQVLSMDFLQCAVRKLHLNRSWHQSRLAENPIHSYLVEPFPSLIPCKYICWSPISINAMLLNQYNFGIKALTMQSSHFHNMWLPFQSMAIIVSSLSNARPCGSNGTPLPRPANNSLLISGPILWWPLWDGEQVYWNKKCRNQEFSLLCQKQI